jgi:hypothetical protein
MPIRFQCAKCLLTAAVSACLALLPIVKEDSSEKSLNAPLLALDQFGGLKALSSRKGGTGFFRVEKFGPERSGRWMLVTPEGHGFGFLGVALVSSATPGRDGAGNYYWDYAKAKYGDSATWASEEKKRLLGWGFNGLGWGASMFTLSYHTQGYASASPLMPHFNEHISFALHSMMNAKGFLKSPVKNILAPVRMNSFPDVYDPGFQTYAFWAMATNIHETIGFPDSEYKSPWVIGVITDESDELKGFGNWQTHPHLGWSVLATAPTQTAGTLFGKNFSYSDTTVYSKLALRDFLKGRYSGDINALDEAWASSYSTWDSDGGWGNGTGLLDENGAHRWMGDKFSLARETVTMQQDLNDFLFQIAKKYFQICHDAVRSVDTNHLIFGPVVVGGPDTRPQVLKAAAEYLDAFWVNPHHPKDMVNPVVDTYNLTGKPFLIGSKVFMALPDSPLSANPTTNPSANASLSNTQEERGQAYARYIHTSFQLEGADGVHPVLGFEWWALVDNFAEKANYGLVTNRDNAYDGKESAVAYGTDAAGRRIGGETKNCGDAISAIKNANQDVLRALVAPN